MSAAAWKPAFLHYHKNVRMELEWILRPKYPSVHKPLHRPRRSPRCVPRDRKLSLRVGQSPTPSIAGRAFEGCWVYRFEAFQEVCESAHLVGKWLKVLSHWLYSAEEIPPQSRKLHASDGA